MLPKSTYLAALRHHVVKSFPSMLAEYVKALYQHSPKFKFIVDRDSSDGAATGGLGSNPGGGEIFRSRPDQTWGPSSLLSDGFRVIPGGKAAEAWR
jgi:hypothetical protein